MLVPFLNELFEFGAQVRLRGEVGNAESFSLQDAKPLFHLVHPRAVDGREMKMKSGMVFQPSLYLFARVHPQIVTDNMDDINGGTYLFLHACQEGNEFRLALAFGTLSVDDAGAGIEGGKELQCPRAGVFVFHKRGLISGLRRLRGMGARSGLQRSLFVDAQHDFIVGQRTGIPINHVIHPPVEFGIPRMFGRQPHVMAPGFQLACVQNSADGLRRDRIHQSIRNHLVCQFSAVPLGQRTPHQIRPLASQFRYMGRHDRLKKKAFGHDPVCPPDRQGVPVETDRATCTRSDG